MKHLICTSLRFLMGSAAIFALAVSSFAQDDFFVSTGGPEDNSFVPSEPIRKGQVPGAQTQVPGAQPQVPGVRPQQQPQTFPPVQPQQQPNRQIPGAQQQQPPQLPGVQPQSPSGQMPGLDFPPQLPTDPDQPIIVNEQYAGWRQAADAQQGARLSDQIRANWVMADPNGRVFGTVDTQSDAELENMRITLLNNGRIVTEARPNQIGEFDFSNVRPGTYTLVGFGKNAFFAFAFNILGYSETASEEIPTKLAVTAVQNKTTINLDWVRYFSPRVKFRVYGRHESKEGSDDPIRLYGVDGLSTHFPVAEPSTSISSHPVNLTWDGRLLGRVHQVSSVNGRPVDLRNTRIMLLQDDDVYSAVTADMYGVFEFPNVPIGEYALVAAGEDGVGCIGIDVQGASDEALPVDMTLATSESVGWINNRATEEAYLRIIARERPPLVDPNNNNVVCPSCNGAGGKLCRLRRLWLFWPGWMRKSRMSGGLRASRLSTSSRPSGLAGSRTRWLWMWTIRMQRRVWSPNRLWSTWLQWRLWTTWLWHDSSLWQSWLHRWLWSSRLPGRHEKRIRGTDEPIRNGIRRTRLRSPIIRWRIRWRLQHARWLQWRFPRRLYLHRCRSL